MLLTALPAPSHPRVQSITVVLFRSIASNARPLSSDPPRAPRPPPFKPSSTAAGSRFVSPLPPLPSSRKWRLDSAFPPPPRPPPPPHATRGGDESLPPPSSTPKPPSRWAPLLGGLALAFGSDALYCLYLYRALCAADTPEEVARLEERTPLSRFLTPFDTVFEEVIQRARVEREERQRKKKKKVAAEAEERRK